MSGFDFVNAKDLQDTLTILAAEGEKVELVAGATNVMNDIRLGKIKDKKLVNIVHLDELCGIKQVDGYIRIGALTKLADIAESQLIRELAPVLYQAAQVFADPITCNHATIGGNIANASPAADTAPPLLVLDAEVEIAKKGGCRVLPINSFFLGVNKTVLASDELITAVRFKPQPHSAFEKVGLRNAMAISVVTVAAVVELDQQGKVASCAIALGSVAPRPVRAVHAEAVMLGTKPTPELYAKMIEALSSDISPIDDIRASKAFRQGVAGTVVERTFKKVAAAV